MGDFNLRKYLSEGRLLKENKPTVDKLKQDILDLIPMNEQDSAQEVRDVMLDIINQIGDDVEKLTQLKKAMAITSNKNSLTVDFLNKFIKSEYGQRLVSDKTSITPTRKNSKDLRLDKVEALEDLTDDHFKTKGTLGIFKWLLEKILNSGEEIETINQYLDLTSNPDNLIKASDLKGTGNIDSLINPTLVKNPIYQSIKSPLFNLNGKGIGKGEALLIVYSSNSGEAPSKQGDVIIDGEYFEVKNSDSGGSIDSGIDSKKKLNIDNINAEFISDLGVSKDQIELMNTQKGGKRNKGTKMIFNHPSVSEYLTPENLKIYFTKLYGSSDGLDESDIISLSQEVYSNKDQSNKSIARLIFPYVYKLYKSKKNFNGLILLNSQGEFMMVEGDILPTGVEVSDWVLSTGGNNQSLPPGYINLKF